MRSPARIRSGDKVEVFNDRGALVIEAFVTRRIRPGVVSIPQGAWYQPDKNGVCQRGCINVLTSQRATPLAHGNAQHTILVEVRKVQERRGDDGRSHSSWTATRCINCKTCEIACKDANDAAVGRRMRKVRTFEGGEFPAVFAYNISMACNHCEDPACVRQCPAKAYTKRESDGIVIHDPEQCIGCRYCTWVCPYRCAAIRRRRRPRAEMQSVRRRTRLAAELPFASLLVR